MEVWQQTLVMIYGMGGAIAGAKGMYNSITHKNPYEESKWTIFYGAFVWGDSSVFGLFWALISFSIILLKDWNLFLLAVSIFWLFRSTGETFYWFLTQFTDLNKDPAEKFFLHKFFPDNSVWFINQILWQCISVLSLIATIFFSYIWIKTL